MRILLLLVFLLPEIVFSQGVSHNAQSGKSAALSGINSTFTDIYSLAGNQAGMGWVTNFGAFAHAERRFLLKELTAASTGVLLPTRAGTFGITLDYFGFELFNEQKIGLAYGRKLIHNLTIGGQLDYFNMHTPDFGNQSAFTFELGAQLKLNKNLLLSSHTLNPIRTGFGNKDPIASNLKLGLNYKVNDAADLYCEYENDLNQISTFRAGLAYRPIHALEIRGSIRSNPVGFAIGMGYRLQNGFGLDLAVAQHQVLGFTPSAGFVYSKKDGETPK